MEENKITNVEFNCIFCSDPLICSSCKNIHPNYSNNWHWFTCNTCNVEFTLTHEGLEYIYFFLKDSRSIVLRYDYFATEFFYKDDIAFHIEYKLLNVNPNNAEKIFNKHYKCQILK